MATAIVTNVSVPAAVTMDGAETTTIRLSIPGRPEPICYPLGTTVTAGDLMNMLLEDLGLPRQLQALYFQGKKIDEDMVLASLASPGADLEIEYLFEGLKGGGEEGCGCCGMHCMVYPECKMRVCCFFHGCDLLFNKLQFFCCTWQWLPPECCEVSLQCVTRICCCVTGCDTKACQFQFYCCKCACCTDIEMD